MGFRAHKEVKKELFEIPIKSQEKKLDVILCQECPLHHPCPPHPSLPHGHGAFPPSAHSGFL